MIYLIIGLVLFILGLSYLIKPVHPLELSLGQNLQKLANRQPWINLFREIWFLGRTTFVFIMILLLVSYSWKLGTIAGAVFLLTVMIEQLVKPAFDRKRPFEEHSTLLMLQPQIPADASFPSGDCLRIWYLALILPFVAGNSPFLVLALILIASLVSAGRLVMGVHYLTDILAGAGLGFLGAGTTVWIWQMLGLL
jgi:undecaprenyl-diphosphatase